MKWILADLDGVLTDGRVTLDIYGNESKAICYRDLDAIGIGRRAGYDFIIVTGEDTDMARVIVKRFGITEAVYGAKDKLETIEKLSRDMNIQISEIVYLGDSDRDATALSAVGLGIAPNDASARAKEAAGYIMESNGGTGVILEVVNKLISGEIQFPEERQ